MPKAVIYARVSSKEQEREGFSIPAQIKLLNDYALKNSLTVVKEFIDSETAKHSGRTNFNAMLKTLKKDKSINIILVEKTDRLYRNFKDYVLLEEHKLEIHLVKEGTILSENSKSHEKFIHGIKVLMAKNFIDNLSEEVRKGLKQKAEQGIYPSKAPVGYKNVIEKSGKRIIEVDQEKAHYIKRAFELYATGNYSLSKLAKLLHQEGFGSPSGLTYYKSKMEYILKNPFYTGIFEYQGKRYENASHEPLISSELYYLVQSKLKDPRKARSHTVKFPYTNLIKCGVCGCYLTAELKKGKYVYYHCTGNKGGD